jgi:hypothetical protein
MQAEPQTKKVAPTQVRCLRVGKGHASFYHLSFLWGNAQTQAAALPPLALAEIAAVRRKSLESNFKLRPVSGLAICRECSQNRHLQVLALVTGGQGGRKMHTAVASGLENEHHPVPANIAPCRVLFW